MSRVQSCACGLACFLALLLAASLAPAPARAAEQLGVVVLHEKGESPDRHIAETVRLLRNVGFLVDVPEMPWSRRRGFDASFQQALVEIGLAVGELRAKGATQVALVGHGLGANAALAFAATRAGVFALVALAPSHDPLLQREVFVADLRKAREMLTSGRGAERSAFMDVRQGKDYDLSTTAEIYLSYSDPDGAAVMPRSAAALNPPVPLLWVVGSNDSLARLGRSYAFAKAPEHRSSRFEEVQADHLGVPAEAARLVVLWLKELVLKPAAK
ncbi:MAG: alpha/beta hydrolase [Proteobacteria bacterium]|nr:alpha/beta hydrolase [Pseudomonadota bacterium]MBU1595704.1 alpha/beta hydrolase [Pseudomonadota bacterium]